MKLSTSRGVAEFSVKPMSGMKAFKVVPRITSKIGAQDIGSMATISRVLKVFDEAELDYLVKEILYSVTAEFEDGTQDNEAQKHFGEIFAGNADQLFVLLYHGFSVNVSEEVRSFLLGKLAVVKAIASALSTIAQKPSALETPQELPSEKLT
jgi:hypothetical protein